MPRDWPDAHQLEILCRLVESPLIDGPLESRDNGRRHREKLIPQNGD